MPLPFRSLNLFHILLLLLAAIQYYLLSPLNTGNDSYISTAIGFEDKTKLIPGFIIPYLSVYIIFFIILFSIIAKRESYEITTFLLATVFLWTLVNLGHGLFHTQNIRPEIKDGGFFFEAVKELYDSVKPYNTLPSWHAATAVLLAVTFFKMHFKGKIFIGIWCLLICLSPLFLKMGYIIDVAAAIPLGFLSYAIAEKIQGQIKNTQTHQEIVKVFTLESLLQSVAIGIRDESTIGSLIDGLTRLEKNLTEKDKEEIRKAGSTLDPPPGSLKEVINDLIMSINVKHQINKAAKMFGEGEKGYFPSDKEMKLAADVLINEACGPFDSHNFRSTLLDLKKKNTQLINSNVIEEAAKDRAADIIFRFRSFLESHKKDILLIDTIEKNTNGQLKFTLEDANVIIREIRKPPYELTPAEVWKAFERVDGLNVKPLQEQRNPANIIPLAQYALGKIHVLEPYCMNVNKKFKEWLEANTSKGRIFTNEELEWLEMMKDHIASFREITMADFNKTPFESKGGAEKAYNIFGHGLNQIICELNEKLI